MISEQVLSKSVWLENLNRNFALYQYVAEHGVRPDGTSGLPETSTLVNKQSSKAKTEDNMVVEQEPGEK